MASPDPFIGREILEGQFQILQKIGSGGMGAVYKALQKDMNRHVAVKILHPKLANRKDLVSRFRREARAMSQLTHPNTVRVFLYGELEDGSLYIVMEFLEGKNLNQTVRTEGPLSIDRALPILEAVCGALHEAHQAGIIHRDLKPENIFLAVQGGLRDFAKVLDFGLAKLGERQMRPGSVILTQEGMVFGTPEFMSPEQAQGKTLTPASDIYSLATILYEVVTGKLPFDAKTPMDFLQLHVNGTPIGLNARVPGRTFSPLLEAVLDRALSKKPELRFATAKDFGEALAAVHAGKSNLPAHLGPVYGVATSDIAHLPTHKAAGVGIAGSPTPSDPAHLRQGSGRPGGSSARPSPGDGTSSRPQSRGGSGGEAIAAPRGSDQGSSSAVVAPARLGTGALVGIALAFMTLGVVIAVVVMQFVQR